MRIRVRRKTLLMVLVAVVGLGFVVVEAFLLNSEVRRVCVPLFESLGADGRLVNLLDDDLDVRSAANDALRRRGPEAIPALIRGLDNPSPGVRFWSCGILGAFGPEARAAIPALKRLTETDEADRVREEAALSLGLIARDDPARVAELLTALESGDEPARLAAERAVPGLNEDDRRKAVPHLIALLKHSSPEIRLEAAEALGSLGRIGRPAIPALLEALAEKEPRVRKEIGEALGHLVRDPEWDDPELRARVDEAIAKSGPPKPGN